MGVSVKSHRDHVTLMSMRQLLLQQEIHQHKTGTRVAHNHELSAK